MSERRHDIDGLRAVAVLAVLWFHYFPSSLPGGFIGVDVFFVISGFVIANSIVNEARRSQFMFSEFYFKRIRRLFPGIVVVTTFCLLAAWAFEFSDEFRSIARDAFYCLIYLVNFHFARAIGYFDTPASPSPLLHFWSLAVEEQFYFIWPALLMALLRLRRRISLVLFLAALVGSALTSVTLSSRYPQFAFYMLPTRMWEFLIGAGIILFVPPWAPHPSIQNLLGLCGAAALIAACVLISGTMVYPGMLAFVPTLATALLLMTPQSPINMRLLSATPMLWLGARSYQTYLWHWPLLIYYPSVFNQPPSPIAKIGMMALTIILAHLTFAYVEGPLRRARLRNAALGCTAASLLVAIVAGTAAKGLFKERLPSLNGVVNDFVYLSEIETINPGQAEQIVFFGDSYIEQFYPRVEQLDKQRLLSATIVFVTSEACAIAPSINRRSDEKCLPFVEKGLSIAAAPETTSVLIGSSWLGLLARGDYYEPATGRSVDLSNQQEQEAVFERLGHLLEPLTRSGKIVYILLTPPGGPMADPRWIARSFLRYPFIPLAAHHSRVDHVNAMVLRAAKISNARIIDPADYLCSEQGCRIVDALGSPIYKDPTHLRASYVRKHVDFLDPLLTAPRKRAASPSSSPTGP